MTEVRGLEQRIGRCTLNLVQIHERLRESECSLENYTDGLRLLRRRTELLIELKMLGDLRRIEFDEHFYG
jgi:hypothetical protein